MSRPRLRTTAIDARCQTDDEPQRPLPAGVLPAGALRWLHESPRPALKNGSCFDHCGPIRMTGCPGPGAQMSVHEGRWVPICRRAIR
jgi:hypothetical protein